MLLRSIATFRISSVGRPRILVAGGRQAHAAAALALLAMAVAACGRSPSIPGGTVDNTNTCTTEVELPARSAELEQSQSLDAVTWTSEPKIEAGGVLKAEGTLAPGAELFDPLREGAPFSVYNVKTKESIELVPNLPDDDQCWDATTITIAPTEVGTTEGAGDRGFTITASSPLFRDVVGSPELELRVWGAHTDGNEALLSKVSIAAE